MTLAPLTIAIHTFGRDLVEDLVHDVRTGLTGSPKSLPPRWFYDERGSELFEAITLLPEYYLSRAETEILRQAAGRVINQVHPQALVELGAGSAAKTRLLIQAGLSDRLSTYMPLDISETFLQRSARQVATDFPGLAVYAVVGNFIEHLDRLPRYGSQLVAFLGSTVGNFDDVDRRLFLSRVRRMLQPGDAFLLGVDLVKDERELVAAYDDTTGLTARFNLNLLRVLNRELRANFDLEAFEHVALYNRERSQIEMHLRARSRQVVTIPRAGLVVDFAVGERLLTEISVKFTRGSVESELAAAGLRMGGWYTDARARFAVCLCVPM